MTKDFVNDENTIRVSVHVQVFLKPTGNFYRDWDGEAITGTVTKVGRKYFYVSVNGREHRFFLEDGTYDDYMECNGGYILYPSLDAFNQAQEYSDMLQDIREYFEYGLHRGSVLPFDVVKQVYDLTKDYMPANKRRAKR